MKQRAIKRVIKRRLAKIERRTFKGKKMRLCGAPAGVVLAAAGWTIEMQYGRVKPCSPYGGFCNLKYYGTFDQDHWLSNRAANYVVLSIRHIPSSQVGVI